MIMNRKVSIQYTSRNKRHTIEGLVTAIGNGWTEVEVKADGVWVRPTIWDWQDPFIVVL